MVRINKSEAAHIRKVCPDIHVTRAQKQKTHIHNYYVEESRRVMAVLNRFRQLGVGQ